MQEVGEHGVGEAELSQVVEKALVDWNSISKREREGISN